MTGIEVGDLFGSNGFNSERTFYIIKIYKECPEEFLI